MGAGSTTGDTAWRRSAEDMDLGRDKEDDGDEFDTIGERVIGGAVMGREEDGPASNDWDNGLDGFELEDDGRWGMSLGGLGSEIRLNEPTLASTSCSGSKRCESAEERDGGSWGSALSKTDRSVARLPREGLTKALVGE